MLGVLAAQVGQHAAAEELIRKAIAAKPGYAEAWFDLGNVMKQLGRVEEAIAACKQAIALKPGIPPAHYNRGHALEGCGSAGGSDCRIPAGGCTVAGVCRGA